ncbi:hypothetical protein AB205_0117830 [Aquarana catesbeiana]|uniref:Uncharacterized protein n=1 Tax=Aquarana catesbeiana TaxID=8400 RepID=A0A2G9R6D3_AQUCT|nr:hypothetical protein AB205_0117830 [Aquarana catesbeiana]
MLTFGNLCASSKFGFSRGYFIPSECNIKHSLEILMSDIAFNFYKS